MTRRVLELREYARREWPRHDIPDALGEAIWRRFGKQMDVEFPSPRTGNAWRLTSKGWVGFIPINDEVGVALRPKVPVRNLFGMLELAYNLDALRTFPSLYECNSLDELYERVVLLLAKQTLRRVQRGLHRLYLSDADRLPYLRGRLEVHQFMRSPWSPALPCRFDEHSADIVDNRLLLWALHVARRSGICRPEVVPSVRQAHRLLRTRLTLEPQPAAAYLNRRYDRLTEDYRTLHALGWFVVHHSGPTHETGDHEMVPFLIDMNRLFERFVAAWMKRNLPREFRVRAQERMRFGEEGDVRFYIDLVLTDAEGRPLAVMDTKYKRSSSPSSDDLAQVVAYAEAIGVTDAILIYPHTSTGWAARVGETQVRTLTFDIGRDLDEAGRTLVAALTRCA